MQIFSRVCFFCKTQLNCYLYQGFIHETLAFLFSPNPYDLLSYIGVRPFWYESGKVFGFMELPFSGDTQLSLFFGFVFCGSANCGQSQSTNI
jgi:hypothetical protein